MSQLIADIGLKDFLFLKYNENHDAKGRFATADGVGGSGLSLREMNRISSRSDKYKSKVYAAEHSVRDGQQEIRGTIPKPEAPAYPREAIAAARANGDLATSYRLSDQYQKDYNKYSRDFSKYQNDYQVVNKQSDLAQQYLDGTKAGVSNYVNAVTGQDWFKQAYTDGATIGMPDVKITNVKGYAGQYTFGTDGANRISINAPYATNEPTILHEIAHYAQTVSATYSYEAHGVGFAQINLHITDNVIGGAQANRLADAYLANGVPIATK